MKKNRWLSMFGVFTLTSLSTNAPAAGLVYTGVLLDLSCHFTGGARGPYHKDCATSCVRHGGPVGFLSTADNVIYLVVRKGAINANGMLARYIGEDVEVQGTVSEQNGIGAMAITSVRKRDGKN